MATLTLNSVSCRVIPERLYLGTEEIQERAMELLGQAGANCSSGRLIGVFGLKNYVVQYDRGSVNMGYEVQINKDTATHAAP